MQMSRNFRLLNNAHLFCFQVPCGGNIFLIATTEENLLIDTGYGIYHDDVMAMFSRYGIGDEQKVSRIVVTHADADHCGAAGFFTAPDFHAQKILLKSSKRTIVRMAHEAIIHP